MHTTLMKPVKLGRKKTKEMQELSQKRREQREEMSQYNKSVMMKKRLEKFPAQNIRFAAVSSSSQPPTEKLILPQDLLFFARNNQSLGSPVNSIKLAGFWASSLSQSPHLSITRRKYWHHLVFRAVMLCLNIVFWKNKADLWVHKRL
ncbi:hypothetical protein H0H81_003122 [Sphagnurus paluster]|uniref:Uncharacterized protein n=1 Tax=Sphagnurus paluster TaxID=117069 RepID=A0A9P7GHU5_9AGAR|nr:hypothetical protein H0H81_003122 [Sphagnurus paluster]